MSKNEEVFSRLTALENIVKVLQAEIKILKAQQSELTGGGGGGNGTTVTGPTISYDVFISLNVASSLKFAEELKLFITQHYPCKVFLCTEMNGGDSFRNQIVDALETCKVFIPLINEEWMSSPECLDEFNHARRLNLISHKIGKTTSPEARLPIILPVYFEGFNFLKYKETRLLASSINFLPLQPTNPTNTWNRIYSSVEYLHPVGMPTPIDANNQHLLDEQSKESFSQCKNETGDSLLHSGSGTFILSGKTVNDYDHNTTTIDRCLITFSNGIVKGTIDYKAGTLYNDSDIAPINGTYDIKTCKTHWVEIYHHGSSHFEYSGIIKQTSFGYDEISGSYFWQEKPTAKGTFVFKLERYI
jgi:hypothetical protein